MELCLTFDTGNGGVSECVVNIKDAASEINRKQAMGFILTEVTVAKKISLNIS